MTKDAHTPGPWKVGDRDPYVEVWGPMQMNAHPILASMEHEPREANAKLMAASPDLDKACDEAWKALAWIINYDSESGTLKRAMETIEAARKKAGTFDYDAMRAEVERNRPRFEPKRPGEKIIEATREIASRHR